MAILVLDQGTINKIAAGEVIERPSSVVKELVENAIDAGATAVTVEIRDGGISLVRITDNGCGIPAEEISLAFQRHATSKITSVEDLLTVSSLGFRGEALSSIAAVAQVELITRTSEALTGVRYVIEGGQEKRTEEVGAPVGTTFVVRNLFFNTPARRKFLKTPQTEGAYISALVERMALSHPEVSFRFLVNGQSKLHTAGNHRLRDIIYTIYGREITAELLPIEVTEGPVKIHGFLGKPIISRGNRSYENYYINGRYIKSGLITKAIENAYHGFVMQHKYPFTVLHLELDPSWLDVNVHPTKMELRFRDEEVVYQTVFEALRAVLTGKELIPQVTVGKEEKVLKKPEERSLAAGKTEHGPEPFEVRRWEKQVRETPIYGAGGSRRPEGSVFGAGHAGKQTQGQGFTSQKYTPSGSALSAKWMERVAESSQNLQNAKTASSSGNVTFGEKSPVQNSLDMQKQMEDLQNPKKIEMSKRGFSTENKEDISKQTLSHPGNSESTVDKTGISGNELHQPQEPSQKISEDFSKEVSKAVSSQKISGEFSNEVSKAFSNDISSAEKISSGEADPVVTSQQTSAARPLMVPAAEDTQQMNLFEEKILTREARSDYRLIGQLFDTYWLVQYQDKFLMIDQHAAHEKVLYERTIRDLAAKEFTCQQLQPPLILTLNAREEQVLLEHLKKFQSIGFEIEHFGGKEYAVYGVPGNLFSIARQDLLLEMLDDLVEDTGRGSQLIEEKVALMSCKAAVKGNHCLSALEADALIDELLTLENPYTCPHGRPTIISMTQYELEKKFKRIVT